MRKSTYQRKIQKVIQKAVSKAAMPKKPVTKETFKGGLNYNSKTGVTKIPGIKFAATKETRNAEKMYKNWKTNKSNGIGVGY